MLYKRTLTDSDFTIENTSTDGGGNTVIVTVANVWTKIGYYTVPKGIRIAVGQQFDGHYYAAFEDSNDAALYARVRIVATDPTRYNKRVISEFSSRQVLAQTSKKSEMPYAPLIPIWVRGDSKLVIEVMPETAVVEIDTTDKTCFEYRIPITYKKE